MGYRDSLLVKNVYYSSRGSEFNSQHIRWLTTTCNSNLRGIWHLWPLGAFALMCTYPSPIHMTSNKNKTKNVHKALGVLPVSNISYLCNYYLFP